MGADSVQLFNKTLGDRILAMDKPALIQCVEENLGALKRRKRNCGFIHSLIPFQLKDYGGSVTEAVERLISDKAPLLELKTDLLHDLAFGEEEIYLDYWGCYAEVFNRNNLQGSFSSRQYFNDEEGRYQFLLPSHVDLMIHSLKKHPKDLPIMGKEGVERLVYFRDCCINHPGYWVAYIFDF
jgi:hypothetical protein